MNKLHKSAFAIVLMVLFSCVQLVFADGTRNMYDGVDNSSYRAGILAGDLGRSIPGMPFPNNATMKVYAKPGEHIYLASSIFKRDQNGLGKSKITWKAPDGSKGEFTKDQSSNYTIGYIKDRTAEVGGPSLKNGAAGGYTPFSITVGPDQEGVWEIEFVIVPNTLRKNGDEGNWSYMNKVGSFNEIGNYESETWDGNHFEGYLLSQTPYMMAFDISVANAGETALIPGRVYTNVLSVMLYVKGTDFNYPWNANFFVLTNTGYLYQINTGGINPGTGTLFANNRGLVSGGTEVSMASGKKYIKGGTSTLKSAPFSASTNPIPTYNPNAQDNFSVVDGVRVYTDVTHKMFFAKPAEDMPAMAKAVYGEKSGKVNVEETWLVSPTRFDAPELTNLKLVGKENNLPGIIGPEGLNIQFDANSVFDYELTMSFAGPYTPRVFKGEAKEGVNFIDWDGLDGSGVKVPSVDVSLSGNIKAAEIHFPWFDLEQNEKGFSLNLLDKTWTTVQTNTMYWDDTDVWGNKCSACATGHSFSGLGTNFGDNKVLDTWTFAESNVISTEIESAQRLYIDLEVTGISADLNAIHADDEVTFELDLSNTYHESYTFAGAPIKVNADAKGASIGIPGFNISEISIISSTDDECQVESQPTAERNGLAYISLKNGHTAKVAVKAKVADPNLSHKNVPATAYFMRPGDYYEIDANNIDDDGLPLNPVAEYAGMAHNNSMSTNIFILNNVPTGTEDNENVIAGQTLSKNVLANDSDVDGDGPLSVLDFTVNGKTYPANGSPVTITSADGTISYGTLSMNADGSYTFLAANQVGAVPTITYTLSDGFTGVDPSIYAGTDDIVPGNSTADLNITIDPNKAPTVTPTNVTITNGVNVKIPVEISDEEHDELTVNLTGEDADKFEVVGDEIFYKGGTTITSDQVYTINVVVNDGVNPDVTEPVTVTVKAKENHAPTVEPTTVTIHTSGSSTTDRHTYVPIVFSDPDGDGVKVTLSGDDASNFVIEEGCMYYVGTMSGYSNHVYDKLVATVTDGSATTVEPISVTVLSDLYTANGKAGLSLETQTIEYGTTLENVIVSKEARDPWNNVINTGSWSYSCIDADGYIYDYDADRILPAGEYTMVANFVPATGNGINSATISKPFTVTPKVINLDGATVATKTYDGSDVAMVSVNNSTNVSGIMPGDLYDITISATGAKFADANAGSGKPVSVTDYVLTGSAAKNYVLADTKPALEGTINQKMVSLDWGQTTYAYDGTEKTVTATVKSADIVGSDEVTVKAYKDDENKATAVGEYKAVATELSNANYKLPVAEADRSTDWSITAGVSVEPPVGTFTYNGEEHTPDVVVSYGGTTLVKGDDYTLSYSEDKVNAGEVIITVTSTDDSFEPLTTKFTINPATITVTGGTAEKTYDGTTVLNATTTIVPEFTGKVGTDDISVKVKSGSFDDANAGSTEVTVTKYELSGSAATSGNYVLATETPKLSATINQKEVSLDWSETSLTYDGTEKSVTATVKGTVGADVVTVATYKKDLENDVTNAATAVGSYTAVATELDNANYKLPETTSTDWSISKATGTITVTFPDEALVYDGTEKQPVPTIKFGDVVLKKGVDYTLEYQNNVNAGKNATVVVKPVETSGYAFTEKTEKFTISPAVINVDATATAKDYDGNKKANVTPTFTGAVAGDDVKVTATGEYANANVGVGKMVVVKYELSGDDMGNYVLSATQTYTSADINKAKIDIASIKVSDKDYDGTTDAEIEEFSISGVVGSENVVVTPTAEFNGKDAGEDKDVNVTYTLSGSAAANYELVTTSSTEKATINKKEVSLTWPTELSFPYDGEEHGITATLSGVLTGEDVEIKSIKDNVKIETGTYTAVVEDLKGDDASNYTLPSDKSKVWSIGKVTVPATGYTITVKEPEGGYTYDGTAKEPVVEVKIGDKVIPADEYEVAYKDNVNAGEATVTVTSKEDSNYFFEEKDANYTINPKGITITDATVAPKTYNGTNNAVVTIDPETGITGIIATDLDKVVVTPKDATFEDANAGTDKVVTVGEYTLTGEAAKNYTIAETPTLKGDIDKAVVTVSGITVADKDYDGSTTANVNTDDMVIGGVLDGEDVKVQVAGAFEDKNAGDDKNVKVTYTLGGDDAANYQLASATSDETASINKKEVGLTWPTELSFPYDGLEHGISATLSGVVTGEDVEISSTKDNVKIETGTYTAVVEGLKGDDADNYVLPTDKSKVWSIGKVTVPATDYTITIKEPEGGYTYDGTAKEPIVEVKIGDEVIPTNEYTFSYKDNVNAGEAKVVISAKENSNYVFEEKDAPFTINKATITVNEPVVTNKVYNGLDVAEVTYTISGVVTGDDVKVGYTANFDDKNAGTQKPVTVNYTLSGDDVANYQLATTTETLKGDITPKEVNLVWNYTDPFTYDGTDKTVTVERIEGVLEGDEVAVSSYADNVKKEVGDYKAKASGIDNTNYVISSTSAEKDWSIVAENGAITIEFVDDDYVYTYNGEEHTPTIIVKIGDVVIPADEYTVSYADNKNAGEATVTVTDKTGGSYEFPAKSAPFTINPVEVTFTSASNTWEYDGLPHSDATVTVTSGELVGDEGFEFTVTGVISEIGSVPNAFTFVAKDGTLASNYAITPAVGTLTIGESLVYPIVNDPVTGDPTIKDPESGSMVPLTDPNKGYTIVVNPSDDPLVYNGTAQTPPVEVYINGNKVPETEYDVVYTNNVNAGTGTLTIVDKEGGNHTFVSGSADFVIDPVAVTFTSASNSWEYDGLPHSDATVTVTSGELVGDEGFEFTVTGVITEIGSVPNAFSFVAKDGTLASNYAITPAVGTLTIGESLVYPIVNDPVTGDPTIKDPESGSMVPLTDPNKGYTIVVNPSDDPLVYNGTAQTPPVEVYINGNKVPETEYDVVYTNNVNAGTGTLTIVDKEGGNHTFVSGSADFVIDPVAVTFTSASNSWTYDGLPHSDATVTVTSGELVGDEGFEFTVTGTITEVGSVNNVFTFTAKEGTLASNYAVTPMVGVLTIENPGIKTVYPIVNDPISGEPSLYNPETGTTSPLDDPNKGYTVVVNPSNDPLVYDGSAQTPPVEIYVNGVKLPETEYDLVYTNNVNAGTGTVSIVDKVGGDYLLIGSDASFSIGPRPLDINWDETQFVYDGTEKVVTSTLTGVVEGDVVNAFVTGNAATVVGDYKATVWGVDNSNYTLSAESVNWTIDKANAVMPELTGIAETEFGSNDGHITGLEEGMLIKKEGDDAFVTVVDPDMDLVPGTYVVKKEGDANHNASEEVSVVVPAGVTSYEIDSLVVSDFGYCPETEDAIRYYVKGSGRPVAYRIVYSADAVNAGFESTDFKAITEEGVLPISIPYCDANTYKAKIQFRSANNVDSKFYDVELPVNLSTRYMVDIWSDVISAVNVEERFEAYQWYHNDVKLEGETKPFYCEQNGLTGSYYMEVLTVDNRNLRTCKLYFAKPVEINLSAYPNPTSDFTTVELSYDNGEEHVLNVYNSAGGAVLSAKFRGVKTVINLAFLPSATYVVNVDGMDVKVIKK